jgi:hypothetical protein
MRLISWTLRSGSEQFALAFDSVDGAKKNRKFNIVQPVLSPEHGSSFGKSFLI